MSIKSLIRTIPDHPKPGIQFRDITTLLQDAAGLKLVIDGLADAFRGAAIDKVAGIEARGFIIAAPVAHALGAGFVSIRKPGKLPYRTVGQDYELEYGNDRIEAHVDAVSPGERVLVLDDLVATGGTAAAAIALIGSMGAHVVGVGTVIDLPDVGGRGRLERLGFDLVALCSFEGD